MKKIILAVLLLSLPGTLRAGLLDIDYLHPSPSKALAYSLVVPGGGYFYLTKASPTPYGDYGMRGVLYFAATAAAAAWVISATEKGGSMAYVAAGAFIGLRLMEFGDVTTDAEIDRHEAYKALARKDEKPQSLPLDKRR